MARENQGLHIVLIVFVVLAVGLGASTWVLYSKNTELSAKAEANATARDSAQQAAEKAKGEFDELSKLITGEGTPIKLDEIIKRKDKDMLDFGGALKDVEQAYHPLVVKLAKDLADKNIELKNKNDEITAWDVKYKSRESTKDPQIKKFEDRANKAETQLSEAAQNFNKRREEVEKLAAATQTKLESERKDATAQKEKDAETIAKLEKDLVTTKGTAEEKSRVINELKRTIVDIPDGEVRWVNQRTGLVWINVGRADGLQPLMTFSVYPADVSDLSKGAAKGRIEVTQILSDHMAEARITDDTVTDPLMPGDKIDTALWNPGEQLHFALAGLLDVNGDDRNDIELVKNLITMNNGVVDCYQDEKGRVHDLDKMSINTRFLVKGGEGKEASLAKVADGISQMKGEADKLGVQVISLKDLLQRMGYKQPISTKATNEAATKFRPKPTEPRTKNPDRYELRQPPTDASDKSP